MILRSGTIIAQNYRIEKPIGENGGMATVYLASKIRDPKLRLAMKFARTGSDGPTHEDKLLERESDLLQKWDWRHPGIVRLYPIERDGRAPVYRLKAVELPDHPYFMIMEYLQGSSLAQLMPQMKNIPFGWKLELFYQILLSVSFLHQKGIGHRDLKPDNIMFRIPVSPAQMPQPVLIDFALACTDKVGAEVVEKSYTLEYASPERILRSTGMVKDIPLCVREEDVWSLGVILFEILTGEHLFKGSERSVRTTIIEGSFREKLREIAHIQPDPAIFVRDMLREDPRERPTIKEIIYAIEEMYPAPRIKLA